jgi:phage shock protein C
MNEFYKRNNPHRLYRDKQNAMLAGVCAGLAEYFGFNRRGTRIVVFLIMLVPPFTGIVLLFYIILAIILPIKPENLFETQEQADFWRGVSNAPSDVFGAIRHRFRELNHRLEKMEACVTSREFEMDRELGRK